MPASGESLEIIPLGGLGEFGMNLTVFRHGRDVMVVDAGMMFPGEDHLGVDVVVPDLRFLADCGTLHGLVLTHSHEDHIGAVPHLLERHDLPVFAAPLTGGVLRRRLGEVAPERVSALRRLPADGESLAIGPFRVEPLPVAHSVPQSKMLIVSTPAGTVLHTADFKLDTRPPGGDGTDVERLRRLGDEGVLLLLSDSTNADRPGTTPSEGTVGPALEQAIRGRRGRVLVTTFSSHLQRLQTLVGIASRQGRRLALVGRSMRTQVEVAESLGLVQFPPGIRVAPEHAMDLPPDELLVLATGSQGEPTSALARISVGKHRDVQLADGDLVIHSARRIPGNEKSIGRMFDHLMRAGADIVTPDDAAVHVSGHPSADELRRLIELVRPRFLVPIHGEYRQLRAHARLGVDAGLGLDSVLLAETGDRIVVDARGVRRDGRVHTGQVFIDGSLDEVDRDVLRDRRRSAGEGVVVAVVALDRDGGAAGDSVEIVTRGFVPGATDDALQVGARRVLLRSLTEATIEERRDEAMLKARIQTELKRFLRRRTQRFPLIIPVIVEL